MATTVHNLKIWPEYFQAKIDGLKPWEGRQAIDRTFRVGDKVVFNEWDPATKEYTGRHFGPVWIVYVLRVSADMDIFTHEMAAAPVHPLVGQSSFNEEIK